MSKASPQASPEDRANYFITYCVRTGSVWALKNEKGWKLLATSEGHQALPVWPRAQDAQTTLGDGEEPAAITLTDWMEQWLPGMSRDATRVAIHPLGNDDGFITQADELLEEFLAELEEMGG